MKFRQNSSKICTPLLKDIASLDSASVHGMVWSWGLKLETCSIGMVIVSNCFTFIEVKREVKKRKMVWCSHPPSDDHTTGKNAVFILSNRRGYRQLLSSTKAVDATVAE